MWTCRCIIPTRAAEDITFSPISMWPVALPRGCLAGTVVTFGQDLRWKWGFKVLNRKTGHVMGPPGLYPASLTGLSCGGVDWRVRYYMFHQRDEPRAAGVAYVEVWVGGR
jgi:hypothetical protein